MTELIGMVDGIEVHHQHDPDLGDGDGVYAITCVGIRTGHLDRMLILDPFALRSLADKIENHQARSPSATLTEPESAPTHDSARGD